MVAFLKNIRNEPPLLNQYQINVILSNMDHFSRVLEKYCQQDFISTNEPMYIALMKITENIDSFLSYRKNYDSLPQTESDKILLDRIEPLLTNAHLEKLILQYIF